MPRGSNPNVEITGTPLRAHHPALQRFAARAAKAVGLRGTVAILIAGDSRVRALNRRFRRKDKATDVLSFPQLAGGMAHAGDIAISAGFARRQARRFRHSVAKELQILALHGLLHLAGHDHETDRGKMAHLEERLRARFRLPTAMILRSQTIEKKRLRK